MSQRANATFQVKSWNEKPFSEVDGGSKLTQVSVSKTFKGEIEGEGVLEYLMAHRDDGTASYVGLERVVGRIGERSGSFVLQHSGTFDAGVATSTWFVVPGTATGDLQGLRGEGGFSSAHAEEYPMTLDYEFE